jgi:hypothetical protein
MEGQPREGPAMTFPTRSLLLTATLVAACGGKPADAPAYDLAEAEAKRLRRRLGQL